MFDTSSLPLPVTTIKFDTAVVGGESVWRSTPPVFTTMGEETMEMQVVEVTPLAEGEPAVYVDLGGTWMTPTEAVELAKALTEHVAFALTCQDRTTMLRLV